MEAVPPSPTAEGLATGLPQNALLDFFFPGFSVFSGAVSKYLHIDLNLYIPLVLLFGGLTFAWRYFSEFFTSLVETHLMSVVDIRADDEIYNYVLAWVANQRFSKTARRFVVNTNLNSRSWYLWRWDDEDEQDEDEVDDGSSVRRQKKKVLAYTPNFGSHWFLYKGRILVFRRSQNQQQSGWLTKSEREEISISCFGRNPWVLKELLHEAREEYMKRDEAKTLIYRGTTKSGSSEPQWQRCLARTSRPLSTVILNSDIKQKLIDDATDYLNPTTRRWYANRGIPYRRGYLLYGPPGTGKSSLSLALAGFFKMRIYIVSLNSVTANEENLSSLFAELPRKCVVLLEDIDTAGLTHTREDGTQANSDSDPAAADAAAQNTSRPGAQPTGPNPATIPAGRLSLSGLLNLLDGVCSQEGRLLVMTTNHLEKLDKALIRPGRVDMIVKFDLADAEMTAAIFRAIYAPLEGDEAPSSKNNTTTDSSASTTTTSRALSQLENALKSATAATTPLLNNPEEDKKRQAAEAEAARQKAETLAQVDALAASFAARIPAHEFSPAELQGYLLKNKRDPEGAVAGAEEWVVSTRKEKKEKELKEAREKREREEKEKKEKEEKEEKEKKEKEEKEKKERKEAKKKAGSSSSSSKKKKASKKKSSSKSDSEAESASSAASSSSDEADSASESEKEKEKDKKETSKKLKRKKSSSSSKPAAPPAAANGDVPALAPAAAAAVSVTDVVDAPAQLNGTEKEKETEESSSASSDPKAAEPPVVVIPPLITVDTDLTLKGTGLEAQRTPAADSGYGTP